MSIASLQSNPSISLWADSVSTQSGASWSAAAVWSEAPGATASGGSEATSNPLQNLASDIQAMLLQARGTTTTTAPASTTSATQTPEQKLNADLQTLMSDLQGAASPNAQTASADPSETAGHHHHHHHHRESGGDASGATAVAGTSTSSGTTAASNDQAVSQIFAADITQALQAYGGDSGASPMAGLVV